jgi:cellulose biosynthesis protein BcsQ
VSEGSLITFYSYKGGVGRTFLLANVAATLARWGYRVLCIDWDLEAPGLAHYFRPWLPRVPAEVRGVVELVEAFAEGRPLQYQDVVTCIRLHEDFSLDLLAAGRQDGTYMGRVQSLDWSRLYRQRHLGAYLESLREQWRLDYDFVLLDSRTGVSDTGGICTVQLPDVLAFVFAANLQSIDGVVEVIDKAIARRNDLPYDRSGLVAVPVLSRFDQRTEYDFANRWLALVRERMAPFMAAWMHRGVDAGQLFEHVRVPYYSVWSFGERLPAIEESSAVGPDRVSFYVETIAALLARGGAGTDQLVANRDSYVDAVRTGVRRSSRAAYDLFVSYTLADSQYATELAEALTARGLSTFFDPPGEADDAARSRRISAALGRSRYLLALIGKSMSRWQVENIRLFLRLGIDDGRAPIPLILPGGNPEAIPRFLRQFKEIDARDGGVAEASERIARLMAAQAS